MSCLQSSPDQHLVVITALQGNALCFSAVPQGTVQIVQRCGKFNKVAHPGCNLICCCIGEFYATWAPSQVVLSAIHDAFYRLTDSRSQIQSYVFDVVRATVPKMILDDVFTSKEEIAQDVKEQLEKSMTAFGFSIIQTLVTDIEPDARVRVAMNEINAASRMRQAAMEKAEAEKMTVIKAAEADAESKFLAGQGVARQRKAIVAGLRESVTNFSSDVADINSRDVIELMLITQYFDTMSGKCCFHFCKSLGNNKGNSTVFLPAGPGGVNDIQGQIRSGFLQAQAGMPDTQVMRR
eukprot:jgi/Astpho2/9809/Aster-03780